MTHAKNQHYVARLYLRRFASSAGGKNPRIWAFDRSTGRTTNPSIRNVAAESYFYETGDGGIEQTLGKLETAFGALYLELLRVDCFDALNDDQRSVVALFVATQMVRTSAHRQQIEEIERALLDVVGSAGVPPPPEGVLDARRIHAATMFDVARDLGRLVMLMKWIRVVNRTQMAYWTSDHPVTLYNPVSAPNAIEGNLGLACSGIQVFFPLSPTVALCLCDPQFYAELPSDMSTDDVETVKFQNSLQLQACTRFVLSSTADFLLAERLRAEYPGLSDLTRPRMKRASP
jgi:hypothetical protein